jgi:hypothetical protein
MKKLLIVLAVAMILAGPVIAAEPEFLIPNLEVSQLYDFVGSRSLTALTSKVFSYGVMDVRIGSAGDNLQDELSIPVGALSIDFKKIANVEYAWDGVVDLKIGVFGGWDFQTEKTVLGVMAILIQIDLPMEPVE